MLQIEAVQVFHKSVEILMRRIIQKIPVQFPLLVPFPEMPQLISHEIQLLARMRVHIHIECPRLRELHAHNPRTFSAGSSPCRGRPHHGTEGADTSHHSNRHGECQLMIIPRPVLGSCPEIIQCVVHPPHIPLIVESKSALFHRFCDARK